jgi:hypothetical protein
LLHLFKQWYSNVTTLFLLERLNCLKANSKILPSVWWLYTQKCGIWLNAKNYKKWLIPYGNLPRQWSDRPFGVPMHGLSGNVLTCLRRWLRWWIRNTACRFLSYLPILLCGYGSPIRRIWWRRQWMKSCPWLGNCRMRSAVDCSAF